VTLVKNRENVFPIDVNKTKRIYMYSYAEGRGFGNNAKDLSTYMKKKLNERGFEVTCNCDEPIAKDSAYSKIVEKYDLILYVLNLNSVSQNTVCRMNWSPSMGEDAPNYIYDVPTIVISFGNPYLLVDLPRVKTYINAYKFKESTVDALLDCMLGKEDFKGISPVDPFCGFWDTRL
jgi:beta-N-acetylhexosaminidase